MKVVFGETASEKLPRIPLEEIVKNAHNFVKKEFNEKDKIIQFNKFYELI